MFSIVEIKTLEIRKNGFQENDFVSKYNGDNKLNWCLDL
jgi:hypothetical protein